MGSCFSSTTSSSTSSPTTAKVVAIDGSLKEYTSPVIVSDVLGADHESCFLCSSDNLYFDSYIPPLALADSLQLGQIYFVLSTAELDYPLTGSKMAALAIKAGSALALASEKQGQSRSRKNKIRVVPVIVAFGEQPGDDVDGVKRLDHESQGGRKKLLAGKIRAPLTPGMVRRPAGSRRRLSTIQEVEE